ncbi:HD domain-containing protein [Lachnospiraceae bacterium ZAX-1]
MKYLDNLLKTTDYIAILNELEQVEAGRRFCKHGLSHLLSVARIAWIENLEQNFNMEKEMIYLAAFLHDIGRLEEDKSGIRHEQSSAVISERMLTQLGYPQDKMREIGEAIISHRGDMAQNVEAHEGMTLGRLIKKADKMSRNCFNCKASVECKWPFEEKNWEIIR